MKLITFAIAVFAALAIGSMFGFTMGNEQGAPEVQVSQPAAADLSGAVEVAPAVEASSAAPVADAAPVAEAPAVSQVGAVGVLQALNADSISVQTREGLQFLSITTPAVGLDQLKVGDKVAVWSQNVNGQLTVSQIVVVPETPERMHYLGLVANATADRLDVVGQQGETTSFRIDGTLQLMPDASRGPKVGDTVTIVAKPDPLGDGWLAVAVAIR
ncbi:MAG TPA: hypothetical protein VJG32_01020 [Anaerolineae bacterium]|nr:hypothetical protein [Anaerolineae bacterium]